MPEDIASQDFPFTSLKPRPLIFIPPGEDAAIGAPRRLLPLQLRRQTQPSPLTVGAGILPAHLDNREVLQGMLGVTDEEFDSLLERQIIAEVPPG